MINNIEHWAIERGLDTASYHAQWLKVSEEFGELAEGIAKGKADLIEDAFGDLLVTLIVENLQLRISGVIDLDIERCLEEAYSQIKDRKGKLVAGVFVKEEDL